MNLNLSLLHSSLLQGDIDALKAAQASLVQRTLPLPAALDEAEVFSDLHNNVTVIGSSPVGICLLSLVEDEMVVGAELDAEVFDGSRVRKMVLNHTRSKVRSGDSGFYPIRRTWLGEIKSYPRKRRV